MKLVEALLMVRGIENIPAHVVVSEKHTDDLIVTDHPVENGTPVSDHAYLMPAKLELQFGWTNSSIQAALDPGYVAQVYAKLLSLQRSREPFRVITGKRTYDNMLMTQLVVTTDERSENSLIVSANCREIIVVETRSTQLPKEADRASPQKNAEVNQTGTQTLRPVDTQLNGVAAPRS